MSSIIIIKDRVIYLGSGFSEFMYKCGVNIDVCVFIIYKNNVV